MANGAARLREIVFDAEENVASFEAVDGTANGTAKDRDIIFNADPENLLNMLPSIDQSADSITFGVRNITYGTNGQVIDAEIQELKKTADGVETGNPRHIRFITDVKDIVDGVNYSKDFIETNVGLMNDVATFVLKANNDDVFGKVIAAEAKISAAVSKAFDPFLLKG